MTIGNAQLGFQPEKATIDAMFIVRQVQEKVLEKREKLFVALFEKSEIILMERKRETVVKIVDRNGQEFGQVEDFKYMYLHGLSDGS